VINERDTESVRRKYDRNTRWFDLMDWMVRDEWRRQLVGRASGRTVEIGVGTGKNLPFFDPRNLIAELPGRHGPKPCLRAGCPGHQIGQNRVVPVGDGDLPGPPALPPPNHDHTGIPGRKCPGHPDAVRLFHGVCWGSIILTSNKSFDDWGQIFGDTVIATAILDRLLQHSVVVNIRGESYRLREKKRAGLFALTLLLTVIPSAGYTCHNGQGGDCRPAVSGWGKIQLAVVGDFLTGLDRSRQNEDMRAAAG